VQNGEKQLKREQKVVNKHTRFLNFKPVFIGGWILIALLRCLFPEQE